VINLNGAQPFSSTSIRVGWPQGHKATKADMKCDASVLHLAGTLKDVYAENKISNENRDE
jgi:hypothetical protein